ncbi:MAG: DNA phosphorothioation system sulfurtransferase DndC [Gammaproteobacteria bacterium]|nr:DNA phosphorothioation system sulfurtransferase DndC [Gammaproteobacteria bacterium]
MENNEVNKNLNYPVEAEISGLPIQFYLEEIQGLYKADNRPWVIGYSGGKDSTAILQLVYLALLGLPDEDRQKPVFVVSSDTLVETPVVVGLITSTLEKIKNSAELHGINIQPQQVVPKIKDTFWVNLIGKGYPAPTRQFRWCTERLKINPVSEFILSRVAEYGEVVVVLGSRIAESSSRAQVMRKHKIEGKRLAKHSSLPSAYVYTPIEDWSADDVWEFLFTGEAPWGGTHKDLFNLYKDSNSGECPLVIDTSTPSCGNSRFGCWVCTVVSKDKAMDGLIETGHTWLIPLQDFRNQLYNTTIPANKNEFRNFKRRTGKVTSTGLGEDLKVIPGPYWLKYRKELLSKLLKIQKEVQKEDPNLELVTPGELEEIRNAWIHDPNEPDWEDSLPKIYQEALGLERDWAGSDAGAFTKLDADLLAELEQKHKVPAAMIMKLIELELSMDGLSRRSAIFERISQILGQDWGALDEILKKHQVTEKQQSYLDAEEAELQTQYIQFEKCKSDAA